LARHWDPKKAAAGEDISYVGIAFDTLLNPLHDAILSRERLAQPPLSGYRWDTQASGVLLPANTAKHLERAWRTYARKPTIVDDILEAFRALGGIVHYTDLYKYLESHASRQLPKSWKDVVRARIEERSSDSQVFKGQDDWFYSVDGLGKGVWGLRSLVHSSPPAPDTEQSSDPAMRALAEVYRIIRDTKVTRQLKTLYQDKCQICGSALPLAAGTYSEAHHVRPLGEPHNGPDVASNVIVVCPNHHAQLDYGAIAIDPDTMRIVFSNAKPWQGNKKLILHPKHILARQFLRYHLSKVFERSI
jgi:hypothetical protein